MPAFFFTSIQVRGACVAHEGAITYPCPPPQNIPQAPEASKTETQEVAVEPPSPFSIKLKEVSYYTGGCC